MKEIPKNPGYNEGCSGNPIVCHFFARKFHAKTLEALMNYSNEFLSEGSWHSKFSHGGRIEQRSSPTHRPS